MHKDPSQAQHQECKAGNLQVLSVWSGGTVSNTRITSYLFHVNTGIVSPYTPLTDKHLNE